MRRVEEEIEEWDIWVGEFWSLETAGEFLKQAIFEFHGKGKGPSACYSS